jgi:hypothetical protein
MLCGAANAKLMAMTTIDYLISVALILLVIPQIRGTRQTLRNMLLPVVAVLTAVLLLPPLPAGVLGGVLLAGLVVADLVGADGSVANLISQLGFCAVLALMAGSMRQAGANDLK